MLLGSVMELMMQGPRRLCDYNDDDDDDNDDKM